MQKTTTSRSSADSKRDSSKSFMPSFPSEGYQTFGEVLRKWKAESKVPENRYVQFCNVLSEVFSEVFPEFRKRTFAEHCETVVMK